MISTIAREFGTSAIPVREALARLHATRLVTFEPNRGYRVASRPTAEDIRQFFQMRLVLETGAIDLAIENADTASLDEMDAINDHIACGSRGDKFKGFREFTSLNERFHDILVRLARNELLRASYDQLADYHQKVRYNAGLGTPDLNLIVGEHREIVGALRAQDPAKAREAITRHISGGYQRLVGSGPPLIGSGPAYIRTDSGVEKTLA